MQKLFPAGIATGQAFYDRVNERKQLKQSLLNGIHTAIISPRRFGKTSLIKKAIDENKLSFIWLDFMTITSIKDAESRFLHHISELIVKICKTEKKVKKLATEYFQLFKPEITVGMPGLLKVVLNTDNFPNNAITEALIKLDELAQATKTQVAIVCDEFQEIVNIDKNSTFQAAIRHAAEGSQSITYLFSGSKHQPLRRLFNGKQSPLYELCDLMTIERVSEKDYRSYLQKEAEKKWGSKLSEKVLEKIFEYTDYYPKYVNALCSKLWFSNQPPRVNQLEEVWENYIFARKTDIAEELNGLTLNQRKLFKHLCFHPTQTPFGFETAVNAEMSTSAIQTALPILMDNDLVVKIGETYRVIDPTFKYYFSKF